MAAVILGAIGLGLQAFGMSKSKRASKRAARDEKKAAERAEEAAEFTAEQYEDKAGQEIAIGTRETEEIGRAGRRLASDARAIGAASGAGGYESNIADITGAADYQALAAMFNRTQSARDFTVAAEVSRREGADAARAHAAQAGAYRTQAKTIGIQGAADLLNGAMSMYERYGQPYKPETSTYSDKTSASLAGYQSIRGVA